MKFGMRKASKGTLALFLALAACQDWWKERQAEQDRSLDGGYDLSRSHDAEGDRMAANTPCTRREKGGWHLSIAHCEEMLPPSTVSGVWVTGFEESSFFPGATVVPDRNDERRYRISLEVEPDRVARLLGKRLLDSGYYAIALTFDGRRTKYSISIDCYGGRSYVFLADTVKKARYLGMMSDPDHPPLPSERSRYVPFMRSGEGGVIGKMEAEAQEGCMRRTGGS